VKKLYDELLGERFLKDIKIDALPEKGLDDINKVLLVRSANSKRFLQKDYALISRMEEMQKNRFKEGKISQKEYEEILKSLIYWRAYFTYQQCWNKDDKKVNNDFDYFVRLAYKAGDGSAAAHIGYCYYMGMILTDKPDRVKAEKYFKEALERGGLFVEYFIGRAYNQLGYFGRIEGYEGWVPEKRKELYEKAIPYYEKAYFKKIPGIKRLIINAYGETGQSLEMGELLAYEESFDTGEDLSDIADEFKELIKQQNCQNKKKR